MKKTLLIVGMVACFSPALHADPLAQEEASTGASDKIEESSMELELEYKTLSRSLEREFRSYARERFDKEDFNLAQARRDFFAEHSEDYIRLEVLLKQAGEVKQQVAQAQEEELQASDQMRAASEGDHSIETRAYIRYLEKIEQMDEQIGAEETE